MSHNHTHSGPTLPALSPEALAELKLPLRGTPGGKILDITGHWAIDVTTLTGTEKDDYEIAAFIADLLNAALTPAAPAPTSAETDAALLEDAVQGRR